GDVRLDGVTASRGHSRRCLRFAPAGARAHEGCLRRYAPGGRYLTCPALRRASMVSSTVRRTVVSNELSAPPAPIASATAAIDTLSGASQRLYASCGPNAYQNPWSFPPTDSMYD